MLPRAAARWPFRRDALPWTLGSLAPIISSWTLQFHHGRHYADLVDSANRHVSDRLVLEGKSALEIMRWARDENDADLYFAAAETLNHGFYWKSLTPKRKRPRDSLRVAMDRVYGDYATFAHELVLEGSRVVGSGWLWLVADRRGVPRILSTLNADTPLATGMTCLLGIDLWEHAYYADHQHRRREYLEAVIDRRLDWDFAQRQYQAASLGLPC